MIIEEFVSKLIEKETGILDEMTKSLPEDSGLNADKITRSRLSEFTKNYIISVLDEPYEPDDLRDRITKSNKLRFNYAIRPKWTLLTYLFGSYESRPPSEITKKLEVFPFYNFYIDSINDLLKDNFSIFITRNEVSLLIDETNKAIYRKLTSDINNAKIKNFFLQVYQLRHGEQDLNLESTIPYSFIKIFLNDKYYFDIEKKFQLVKGINDDYEISLKDVIKVLMNKYDLSEPGPGKIHTETLTEEKKHDGKVSIRAEEKAEIRSEETPEEMPEESANVISITESADEDVRDDEVEDEFEAPTSELAPEEEPEPEDSGVYVNDEPSIPTQVITNLDETTEEKFDHVSFPGNGKINEEELEETEETTYYPEDDDEAEPQVNRHQVEIKKLFTEKQFEKILDKVYRSDFEYVARSFMKLGNFKTWFEASNHLRDVFKANDVDIYNKDVVMFVDILNDYYTQRG